MASRPSSFSHSPTVKLDIANCYAHFSAERSNSTISHLSKSPSLPGFTLYVKIKNPENPSFYLGHLDLQ
jgi:hypothetical protein